MTRRGGKSYPLDKEPGAVLAYSTRLLTKRYMGRPLLRIRRSSDNAELDIGSVGGWLDTAAALAFVGAGDGFVTTWYDQVGGKNAINATAAQQPQLIASGALNVLGTLSRPAMLPGSGQRLVNAALILPQPFNIYSLSKQLGGGTRFICDSANSTQVARYRSSLNKYGLTCGADLLSTAAMTDEAERQRALAAGASSEIWSGAVSKVTGDPGAQGFTAGITIGARYNGVSNLLNNISELVLSTAHLTNYYAGLAAAFGVA